MTKELPKRIGPAAIGMGAGALLTVGFMLSVHGAVADAKERLLTPEVQAPAAPTPQAAEESIGL